MSNIRTRFFVFAISTLGFVVLGSGIFKIYDISQTRKNNYNIGITSLNRGECDRALQKFDLLIKKNTWFNKIDRLTDEVKPYQQQCQSWKTTVKKVDNAKNNNNLAQVLVNYGDFAKKYPSSKLVNIAKQKLKVLFGDVKVKLFTSDRSCQQVNSLLKHELIPDRDRYLPLFYLGCVDIYQEKQDRELELNFQTKFLVDFPQHEKALTIKQGLIQNPLVCERSQRLQTSKVISDLGNLMPVVYLACAKAYQEVKNYKQAISFYRSVEINYPDNELVRQANFYLAAIDSEINEIAEEMSNAADTIKGRITACTAGSFVFDWLIDLGELFSGKDCMTGESLHDIERWLTILPLVDGLKGASKLGRLWQIIDTVATFTEIQQTQNLLQDRQSLLDFLDNEVDMELLIAHNSNLASLVVNMGNAIDLSQQYSEVAQLLD